MRSARQALREFLGWGNAAPPHGRWSGPADGVFTTIDPEPLVA